jgi:hypothetical protein
VDKKRPFARLDQVSAVAIFAPVSVLQIKQSLSRLSAKEQREIQIYLHQLRRRTPAWKKATAKRISEVRAGKFTTVAQLEALYRRG